MRTKGSKKLDQATFIGVTKLLANGWKPVDIAESAGIAASTVVVIRQAKTWEEYQRRNAKKYSAARAVKSAKASKAIVTKPAMAKKPAAPRKQRAAKDDALQAAIDSIRHDELALIQGQLRDVLAGQEDLEKLLNTLSSDTADVKYDTARIRWNQLNPFRRKK